MKIVKFFNFILFFSLYLLATLFISNDGYASSSFTVKNPPPIHLNHLAVDLIDVARFEISKDEKIIPLIDYIVKTLGDSLTKSGYQVLKTDQILAPGISSTASYSYGNFLVKIAESTGTRLLEVRLPDIEKQILANDPMAVLGLPFRYIIFPSNMYNRFYIHICLVDPVSYTRQFTDISPKTESLLREARTILINKIKETHPLVYFDPQFPNKRIRLPKDIPPVISLAEVQVGANRQFKTIDDVIKVIQSGDLILFRGTPDERVYKVGSPTQDFRYLNDKYTFYKGFLCFPRFSAIKDGWVTDASGNRITFSDYIIKDKSEAMHNLVPNSIIHAYGRSCTAPEQKLKFDTSKGPVYMLQVFDAYIHPAIMNTGLWHFASIPLSIIFYEKTPGIVNIEAQNPVFMMERYFQDVSNDQLQDSKIFWNSDPKTKTYWPDLTIREMGEYVLNNIKKKINNALVYGK